jgi:3-oxoacyl-[acyl-carrier-protein] synthase-3
MYLERYHINLVHQSRCRVETGDYLDSAGKKTNPYRAKISAIGGYVPPGVLTNHDLERMVETNDQWILERTGIRERHILDKDRATSDMAVEAARAALAARGIDSSGLHAIIVCTVTPDMLFPSTACLVQDQLGAAGAWGYDLIAACSGFVYGLTTAAHLVSVGEAKKVLVVGADTMSRILDYTDRSTCILFGDGAGAFLVETAGEQDAGFLDYVNEVDGSGGQFLKMPAGGSRLPASQATVEARQHFVHQEGQQVFKYAVRKMAEMSATLLERNGLRGEDVKLLIPHQANRRIIEATAKALDMPLDRVIINIDRFGNTTAATIPLATRDAVESGKLQKGDLVLFAAVGAGYTAGANLWRWQF